MVELNYDIQHKALVLFLISLALISSASLTPLVYSQEFYPLTEWGKYGVTTESSFKSPEGIAVDQAGNVYVADTANNRVQVFSSNGTFMSKWGKYGVGNSSLNYPQGIAVDQAGNVYVADTANNRVQVFSSNGTFMSKWGKYGVGNSSLNYPQGIAVDQAGNVYVADTANNRVQV